MDRAKILLATEQEATRKLQLHLQGKNSGSGSSSAADGFGSGNGNFKHKGPKMAPYDEKDDIVDSYLFRFERYAEFQNWPEDQWAIYLSALLRGKALDVYARLTADDSKDHKVLRGVKGGFNSPLSND